MKVTVAALQQNLSGDAAANVPRVEAAIRDAAACGAQVILPGELFASHYFPQVERPDLFALAHPLEGNPIIDRMRRLAAELGVVIPVSYFERAGQAFSLLILDEVFGSLDETRRANVVELLRHLHDRFEQVIVITHIEQVRDGLDRVLLVRFDEARGCSVVQASGPVPSSESLDMAPTAT